MSGHPYDLSRATALPPVALADTRIVAERIVSLLVDELRRSGLLTPDWPGELAVVHRHLARGAAQLADGARAVHDETHLMLWLRTFATTDAFQEIYRDLIRQMRDDVVRDDFVFEAVPVVRCILPSRGQLQDLRLPDGTLVALHTDILYQDPAGQLNAWLALTETPGSCALQLTPLDVSLDVLRVFFGGDMSPREIDATARMRFFRFLADNPDRLQGVLAATQSVPTPRGYTRFFDARQLHGTADNRETVSRVSMDFRMVPLAVYDALQAMPGGPPCYTDVAMTQGGFYAAERASQL